jgi:hypothetical protein
MSGHPARNEAELIEGTLRSVIAQTHPPTRWVIVSDGSTDATDQIVRRYGECNSWIELRRLEAGDGRDFARKARAFNAGGEHLRGVPYDVIGNLDADFSFDEDLFRFLLQRFAEMPDLGVAGTLILERETHYDYRFTNIDDVRGCCQLFRRDCLEGVGGYLATEGGGIDCIAVTLSLNERLEDENVPRESGRPPSKAGIVGRLVSPRQEGLRLGRHPLWQLTRSVYQSTSQPYVIGGLMFLAGYAFSGGQASPAARFDEFTCFADPNSCAGSSGQRVVCFHTHAPASASRARTLPCRRRWSDSNAGWKRMTIRPTNRSTDCRRIFRPLTFGNQLLEQLLLQSVRQSPGNLAPALGIRPLESTKGRGYMASGYLAMLELTGEDRLSRQSHQLPGVADAQQVSTVPGVQLGQLLTTPVEPVGTASTNRRSSGHRSSARPS